MSRHPLNVLGHNYELFECDESCATLTKPVMQTEKSNGKGKCRNPLLEEGGGGEKALKEAARKQRELFSGLQATKPKNPPNLLSNKSS